MAAPRRAAASSSANAELQRERNRSGRTRNRRPFFLAFARPSKSTHADQIVMTSRLNDDVSLAISSNASIAAMDEIGGWGLQTQNRVGAVAPEWCDEGKSRKPTNNSLAEGPARDVIKKAFAISRALRG